MTLDPLLAEMKTAAQALRPDHANTQPIQRLLRACEAIQTTSSLVRFEDVADFTGHVLDLLRQLQAEAVPVTYHLPGVLTAAADQIALLLIAAQGGPPVDISLQAALLETIFQITEPTLSPVPRKAKIPQPDREASLQDAIVLRPAQSASGH